MIATLLPFILAILLVVLANLGQIHTRARWLTYALLAIVSLLACFAGVAFLLLDPSQLVASPLSSLNLTSPDLGIWLSTSGAASLAIVAVTMILHARGRDPSIGRLYWARPVQLTAIVMIVLYAGGNLALASLLDDPSLLTELGLEVNLREVIVQYVSFVALAFLGVGLGIRRTWRESLARLKINRLDIYNLAVGCSFPLVLVMISAVLGGLLTLFSPESVANATAFNEIIVEGFRSPGGAITLGLLSGIGEELLYRGALQPTFGLWATSFIFALHHIQYLNPSLLLIFVLGLTLGWIRNRWGTATAALVHAGYNAILVLLAMAAAQM